MKKLLQIHYIDTHLLPGAILGQSLQKVFCRRHSAHYDAFLSYTSWLKLQTDGIFFMQDATIFEVQHSIP